MQDDQVREILQSILDTGARALLANDPEPFLQHVHFPHILLTEDTQSKLNDPADMLRIFRATVNTLIAQGVTDYIRIVAKARLKENGAICGQWTSHVLRHAHRVLPPFPGRGQLIEDGGVWKFTHTVYGIRSPMLPDRLPSISEEPHLRELNLIG